MPKGHRSPCRRSISACQRDTMAISRDSWTNLKHARRKMAKIDTRCDERDDRVSMSKQDAQHCFSECPRVIVIPLDAAQTA